MAHLDLPMARLVRSEHYQPSPSTAREDCAFYPEVFPLGHRLIRSTNEHYTNFSSSDLRSTIVRYPMIRSTNDETQAEPLHLSFKTKSGILCSTIMLYDNVFTFHVLKHAFDILKG